MSGNPIFNSVPVNVPEYNTFDLSHDIKLSAKCGELIPLTPIETVPGDIFNVSADLHIKFAPLIAPIMHRFNAHVHYWYVPNFQIWPNWPEFISSKTTGGLPTVTIDDTLTDDQYRLLDYFGIPDIRESWSAANPVTINALPLMAYQWIYNEWYRDQNLISELNCELADGNQSIGIMATIRKRAWQHDYFTSSLPSPQKGSAVNLPYGDVVLKSGNQSATDPMFVETVNGTPAAGDITQSGGNDIQVGGTGEYMYDPDGTLTVQPQTIAEFRYSLKLQEYLELLMRGGQRYIEVIKNFFGEQVSDLRLWRPHYIGGIKVPITISEVLNTSGTFDGANPEIATSPVMGTPSGHGVAMGVGQNSSFKCEDHGYIIPILNVQPIPCYQQGIARHWLRNDPYDYYWKQFAHIGEQDVNINEIFAYEADQTEVFGYQARYAEYKSIPPRVAGDFRTTLNHWHAGRIFATKPSLNQEFIECDPGDVSRIFAVQDGTDYLWCQVVLNIYAKRKMAVYGEPIL